MQSVFNLTVEGAHCYFANDILVHNCDTVSMGLRHLRDIGMLERGLEITAALNEELRYRGRPPAKLYPG